MKERPILFSGPMVRAILDGSKTQTRRVVKPQPERSQGGYLEWKNHIVLEEGTYLSPYGEPGDRLWVRETFANLGRVLELDGSMSDEVFIWRASTSSPLPGIRWTPSIHMPRRASRITLEVQSVRVERMFDISRFDAEQEGVDFEGGYWRDYGSGRFVFSDARDSFRTLWESINGPGSWAANPWVWVIEFQRIES